MNKSYVGQYNLQKLKKKNFRQLPFA